MVSNHACIANRRGTDKNIPAMVSFMKLLQENRVISGEWKRILKSMGKTMFHEMGYFHCSKVFLQKSTSGHLHNRSIHFKKKPTKKSLRDFHDSFPAHLWSPKYIQRRRDPAKPPRCESPGTESNKEKNECRLGRDTRKKDNLKKEAELLVPLHWLILWFVWNGFWLANHCNKKNRGKTKRTPFLAKQLLWGCRRMSLIRGNLDQLDHWQMGGRSLDDDSLHKYIRFVSKWGKPPKKSLYRSLILVST